MAPEPERTADRDRLRWGILGAARIATRRLLPAFARSRTAAVVAIASRDPARAQAAAAQFGIPRVHGSYDALLADPDVDAVYIPLPNSLHAAWTIRAAQAGKHVLCEKPLALNAAEAETMVSACRRAGVLLQEAFMHRFHPQIETLLGLLAGGAIGRPALVRSAFTFTVRRPDDIRLNPALGGGGLMDVGCYCVNISRLILGEPLRVAAAAAEAGGVDVFLAGLLQYADAAAVFDCGLSAPFRQVCEVVGSDGTITVDRPFQPEEQPAVLTVRRGDDVERIEVPGTNQYTQMIDHFGRCVRGEAVPRYPPEDAVANMRVIDALYRSTRERVLVAL